MASGYLTVLLGGFNGVCRASRGSDCNLFIFLSDFLMFLGTEFSFP